MNSGDIIVNVKSIDDIDRITTNSRYINISIDNYSRDVIDYFLNNGSEYSYSDIVGDRNGFIYANYDMFKYSENVLNNIISNIPSNLNTLEKIRYIYISLGKILCVDINNIKDKNDNISLSSISTVNNIWGAIYKHKVGDVVVSKIFMYMCSKLGIKCELISSSIKGNIANKIYFDNKFIIVDLYNDICNIQGGFVTKYFDKYNDDKEMDKKINYIKDEYMDYYLDNIFKKFDYDKEDILYEVLSITGSIMDISNIGSYELYQIYKKIFDKYFSSYDIKSYNMYINNYLDVKDHFTIYCYGDKYYSFNYSKGCFIYVDMDVISNNIDTRRVGIYDGEEFDFNVKGVVL